LFVPFTQPTRASFLPRISGGFDKKKRGRHGIECIQGAAEDEIVVARRFKEEEIVKRAAARETFFFKLRSGREIQSERGNLLLLKYSGIEIDWVFVGALPGVFYLPRVVSLSPTESFRPFPPTHPFVGTFTILPWEVAVDRRRLRAMTAATTGPTFGLSSAC
jgi:hypothetical protein